MSLIALGLNAVNLVLATHPDSEFASNEVRQYVKYGSSPRGAQALTLMNSPFVMERAKHIATRPEVASASSATERVNALFHLVFARDATPEEAAICQAYATPTGDEVSPTAEQATWEQLAHVLLMSNAFVFVD